MQMPESDDHGFKKIYKRQSITTERPKQRHHRLKYPDFYGSSPNNCGCHLLLLAEKPNLLISASINAFCFASVQRINIQEGHFPSSLFNTSTFKRVPQLFRGSAEFVLEVHCPLPVWCCKSIEQPQGLNHYAALQLPALTRIISFDHRSVEESLKVEGAKI